MLKFQAEELNVATNVPFNQVAAIDALDAISVPIAPHLSVDFVIINASRTPLDDVNVRLALNYATDRLAKAFNSSDVIDPSQYTASYLCRLTQPVMGVCHEAINQLFADSETMMVVEEREAAFHRIMRMANEWATFIPIYYAPARTAIWDRVHGFQVLPIGNFRLWEVWVER